MKSRNNKIDMMKGLLIILMVAAHTQFWAHNFIFTFHMTCFFMISGFLYNKKYVQSKNSLNQLFKARLKNLYIPYIISNIIFLISNNLLYKFHLVSQFYSINDTILYLFKILVFSARMPINDSTWFLQVMFYVTIIYYFIEYVFKNNKNSVILTNTIYIILLILGYYMNKINFNTYELGTIFSMIFFFNLGRIIKEKSDKIKINNKILFASSTISLLFLLILTKIMGSKVIRVMQNQYYNPLILILSSLAGFCLIYTISYFIDKKKIKKLSSILQFIGRKTIYILVLHIFSFKIVSLLIIGIYNLNIENLSVIPVLTYKNWWFAYTIAGVNIPLVFYKIKIEIEKRLGNHF